MEKDETTVWGWSWTHTSHGRTTVLRWGRRHREPKEGQAEMGRKGQVPEERWRQGLQGATTTLD